MATKIEIANVEVLCTSEYSDYALSWTTKEARFHVWLDRQTKALRPDALHKRSHAEYKQEGYFYRRLKVEIPRNAAMIEEARRIAEDRDLYTLATYKLKERDQAEDRERWQNTKKELTHRLQSVASHRSNAHLFELLNEALTKEQKEELGEQWFNIDREGY